MKALARVVLCAMGAGGCASAASRVAPEALLSSIDSGTPPVIVDVRTLGEYEAGHVPGALHVPFYTLRWSRDRLPASPEQAPALPIVGSAPMNDCQAKNSEKNGPTIGRQEMNTMKPAHGRTPGSSRRAT